MKFDLQDFLLILGIGSIVAGVALWSRPAALVVFGFFCLFAVFAIARSKRSAAPAQREGKS